MNRLVPTEKYIDDCVTIVGDDENAPAFQAHRLLLRRLQAEELDPSSGADTGVPVLRREHIDREWDLLVAARAFPELGQDTRVELRGLKRVRRGSFLL